MIILPTKVRLTLKFLVGELKKSTLHLYTPPSDAFTDRICSLDSLSMSDMAKYNRWPKSSANDECAADFNEPARESKLKYEKKKVKLTCPQTKTVYSS